MRGHDVADFPFNGRAFGFQRRRDRRRIIINPGFARLHQRDTLVVRIGENIRLSGFAQDLFVHLPGPALFRRIDGRVPAHIVEPTAKGVDNRDKRRTAHSPARRTTHGHADDAFVRIMNLFRQFVDFVPGRFSRHGQTLFGKEFLVIHDERGFSVEG